MQVFVYKDTDGTLHFYAEQPEDTDLEFVGIWAMMIAFPSEDTRLPRPAFRE